MGREQHRFSFDRRSRDDGATIQPSLSRKAANSSCFGYRHFDRRVIGVGDRSLAARRATTGDVVLVCTLGLSVLHATRDLAVALVDVTKHIARLSEALSTLLVPHQLRDRPEAVSLVKHGISIAFENTHFAFRMANVSLKT